MIHDHDDDDDDDDEDIVGSDKDHSNKDILQC